MIVTIIGFEWTAGLSNKTGVDKEYKIKNLYAMIPLEEVSIDTPRRKGKSRGMMGATYDEIELETVQSIDELPTPFEAELTLQDVMKFGKKVTKVIGIRPMSKSSVVVPVHTERKAA